MLDGYAKLTLGQHSDGPVMEVLGPGSIFVISAIILDEGHVTTANLLIPSRILFIPAAFLRSIMQLDHGLSLFLLERMGDSLQGFVVALGDRNSLNARERISKHYSGNLGSITGSILKKGCFLSAKYCPSDLCEDS